MVGRPFKPGQSGNPKGRPVLLPEVKENRAVTLQLWTSTIRKYLECPKRELEAVRSDPDAKMIDAIICGHILQARNSPDPNKMEVILTRVFGKPKETMDLSVHSDDQTDKLREAVQSILDKPRGT